MKAIKFNTINFELVNIAVTSDHLSATIAKRDYAVDDIIDELEGTTTVTISEDDETTAVYNGYSKILAVTFYKDYDHEEEPVDIISVELINVNLQQQINDLFNTVENVQSEQNSQANTITNLSGEINRKLDAGIIGDIETIGEKASRSYDTDETFVGSNGKYYKAIVPILAGTVLVVNGNCEETSISEELKAEE